MIGNWLVTFVSMLISILNIAIFARVILSWFPIDPGNPIVRLLFDLTEPILAPFRRVLPRIGMIDLSPLAAILVLNFISSQLHYLR